MKKSRNKMALALSVLGYELLGGITSGLMGQAAWGMRPFLETPVPAFIEVDSESSSCGMGSGKGAGDDSDGSQTAYSQGEKVRGGAATRAPRRRGKGGWSSIERASLPFCVVGMTQEEEGGGSEDAEPGSREELLRQWCTESVAPVLEEFPEDSIWAEMPDEVLVACARRCFGERVRLLGGGVRRLPSPAIPRLEEVLQEARWSRQDGGRGLRRRLSAPPVLQDCSLTAVGGAASTIKKCKGGGGGAKKKRKTAGKGRGQVPQSYRCCRLHTPDTPAPSPVAPALLPASSSPLSSFKDGGFSAAGGRGRGGSRAVEGDDPLLTNETLKEGFDEERDEALDLECERAGFDGNYF